MSFFKKLNSTLKLIKESKLNSKEQQVNIKIEKEQTKKNIKKVLKYLVPAIIPIIWYIIFEIGNTVVNVFFPLNEAKLFNNVTLLNFKGIKINILAMALIYVGSVITTQAGNLIWNYYIKHKITFAIRKDMCKQILNITNETFDSSQTGTFIGRISGDVDSIVDLLDRITYRISSLLTNCGVFIAAFFISWKIGLVYLLQVLVLFFWKNKSENTILPLRKQKKTSAEKLRSILTEMIRGIRDIKNLNIKEIYSSKVEDRITDDNSNMVAVSISRSFFNSTITLFRLVCYVLLFTIGCIDIKSGILTAAELITLYLYAGRCMGIANGISDIQVMWNDLALSMNRAFSFDDEKEFPKDKFGTRYIEDIKGNISFKDVTFGYNDEEKVLKNISFDVKEKSSVAFVGESGAGKTTILSLLTKNYNLENHGKGHIYIDGLDIEEFSEKSFRKVISYIPQMPYIFNMSIKDNLLLVKENATDEEIDEALKKACLYDYVESLPNKKDSVIGEGGINLSGGQRQRLAIARSLLKDCKILILDEATSALDNITQNEIKNVINNLASKYTVITIAHRLSTIKEADKIYVLDKGKIAAKGKHEELLSNPIYSRLYAGEAQ